MNRRIGGHVSTAGGLKNAIQNTLAIGGNAIQIFAGSPRMWIRSLYPAQIAEDFKKAVVEHDLNPVYIHALYLTNLASDNPELVAKSKKALILDMTNSAAIGSAGVVLHIGSHQGRGWDAVREQVIKVIGEVLDETPTDSTLCLENSAGQNGKIGTFAELSDILQNIQSPRLRVCLDTAHAFESGFDFTQEAELERWIKDIDAFIGDRMSVIHLNDSKTPVGSGRDMHQNIGDGYIGNDGLQRLINHPRLRDLPLLLEVPGMDGKSGPDKENIQRVKKLLE
jgi:deoxyribonuclease-4